jgi:lipoprotein-anchoring transpeptidase ErfK/SrfK
VPGATRRALLLLPALLVGCGGATEPAAVTPQPTPATEALAPAEAPSAAPPAAAPAWRARGRWTTARLGARVALRSVPGGRAVGRVGPRTQFGGPRVLSVLRQRGAWLQVVVPERPNARPGWISAAHARLGATDVSIRIDRSSRTLTVRDRDRAIQRVRIGVGAPAHPTPTGRFAVTDKLQMGGPGTTYGCCAIALSAHQPNVPATWNGLDRIAVHGTQSPETIGTAASLGCMHASERDLRRLMRTVPLGAPVFIRA